MSEGKIISFTDKRNEMVEQKRRSFERVLFQNLLGTYSMLENGESLSPIRLVDISRSGCLFQVPWNTRQSKRLSIGMEVNTRMYFTQDAYVPVTLRIKYSKEHKDEKDGNLYMRYGCEFDASMPSFSVIETFIEFLYQFAEHSTLDHGERKAFLF